MLKSISYTQKEKELLHPRRGVDIHLIKKEPTTPVYKYFSLQAKWTISATAVMGSLYVKVFQDVRLCI